MARIVTLGEIMLRLKSPALERFFQSPSLEATFGGGEANVAVSLANYGMDAAFVTALPNNAIGEACLRDVRSFGVDVSNIKMMDGRMGIYFLETGSNQRPSKVVYDRADSCIAMGTGNNVHADQFAHALGCRTARFHSGLHRADVAANHHRHQTAAHMLLADEMHVRRFDHRVGCLNRTDQTLGFNHTQRFHHGEYLLFLCFFIFLILLSCFDTLLRAAVTSGRG